MWIFIPCGVRLYNLKYLCIFSLKWLSWDLERKSSNYRGGWVVRSVAGTCQLLSCTYGRPWAGLSHQDAGCPINARNVLKVYNHDFRIVSTVWIFEDQKAGRGRF